MLSPAVQSSKIFSSQGFTATPISSKLQTDSSLKQAKQRYFLHHAHGDISVDTPDRAEVIQNGIGVGKIHCILGKGSFGTVIPGKYKGQIIAVKLVPKEKQLLSLKSEKNAAKLSHPNIVKTLKVVCGEGNYGMVLMENVGINLQELLLDSSHVLNMECKHRYAMNVAYALEYCHACHILHLDVKPKNILVCRTSNTCKLCDFGSSLHVDDVNEHFNIGMNTVQYTAPELFRGGTPTEKADVYSFAITMWQLMSQCVPYEGMDSHIIIYRVVANEYRPDDVPVHSRVQLDFTLLYKRCWRTWPLERPLMADVIQELKRIQSL